MLSRLFGAALLGGLLLPYAATAQDSGAQSRPPLGSAIREVLIATPELLSEITGLPRPAPGLYGEEAARDLDTLDQMAAQLFNPSQPGFGPTNAPTRLAFFTAEDCPDCPRAEEELRALAERLGFRVAVFDIGPDAALARRLGLDMAPSYVLPDMMLRGAMPAIVLERYLTE
jgi:thiol-disulfide isomerase/thioredoxin